MEKRIFKKFYNKSERLSHRCGKKKQFDNWNETRDFPRKCELVTHNRNSIVQFSACVCGPHRIRRNWCSLPSNWYFPNSQQYFLCSPKQNVRWLRDTFWMNNFMFCVPRNSQWNYFRSKKFVMTSHTQCMKNKWTIIYLEKNLVTTLDFTFKYVRLSVNAELK